MNVFELFAKLSVNTGNFDSDLDKAAKSVDNFGDATKDMKSDSEKADAAVDKMADAVSDAGTEAKQADSAMGQAADGIKDVGDESGDAAGGLDDLAGKFTEAAAKGSLIASAIEGIWNTVKSAAEAIWNLDESTEDFRVAMGKLNTAFQTVGYSSAAAKGTFTEFYKILGDVDTATEASQLLARLSTNQQELSRWTTIAAGVNGTFGDSLPIEGLIEASNETAKVGQVTGVLADALNWVGISEDDFNIKLSQCADTQERTALITDTLAGKYNDAASAMYENNAAVIAARESQLRLQSAQAKVGEQTSRLKTALSTILAPAMQDILSITEKLVNGAADLAEKWARVVDKMEHPIDTDDIEEARKQLEAMKRSYDAILNSSMDEVSKGEALGLKGAEIERATAQLEEMEAKQADVANAANAAADGLDKMTVSANGFSVELTGVNMTVEEATELLGTYTSAATNMFSQINTESELSYAQALENMQHNIDATNQFSENMAQLVGVLPQELADMLFAGGPEMYAGVVSMLAEANAGSEEGLAELIRLWTEGGEAGKNAFLTAIGIPADAENPATQIAQAMNDDTSAEEAGTDVASRTAEAVKTAVYSGEFQGAGESAMQQFINGMWFKSSDVYAVAESIASTAAARINNALSSIGASTGGGRGHAGGLDYVPYNGYPAVLHRGEAVLTSREADSWRKGGAGNTAAVQPITLNLELKTELDGATVAKKTYKYILKEAVYHGDQLIKA